MFIFGDVQEELQDPGSVVREGQLEVADCLQAALGHLIRNQMVNARDQHFLVVRAVENADVTSGWASGVRAPQKVMGLFPRRWRFERRHDTALWIDAAHHVSDCAVLTGRIDSLKYHEHRAGALGVEPFLQRIELSP